MWSPLDGDEYVSATKQLPCLRLHALLDYKPIFYFDGKITVCWTTVNKGVPPFFDFDDTTDHGGVICKPYLPCRALSDNSLISEIVARALKGRV